MLISVFTFYFIRKQMGYEFIFYEILFIENFQEERERKLFLCMFLEWLFCVNSRGWLLARTQT